MDPKAQALAALRDIHLPHAIGWWPLAPGWYALAVLFISLSTLVIVFVARSYVSGGARRQAQRLLTEYQQQYLQDAHHQSAAARVSELLKRVALVYFPREEVASLQGEAWIVFLNSTAKGLDFSGVRIALLEAPYHAANDCDLEPLFRLARSWITQRRGRCLN